MTDIFSPDTPVNVFGSYSTYDSLQDLYTDNTYTWFPQASMDPIYEAVYSYSLVWVPPTPYIPGTEAQAATETEYNYSQNLGWNSWARSIEQLDKGKYYVFNCNQVNEGIFLGLGHSLLLGGSISLFSHAIIADVSGLTIYEDGVEVKKLAYHYSSLSSIKIFYDEDNSVKYAVTTGTETLVFSSDVLYTSSEAFIHCYIYSSNDTLDSSEYVAGTVQYGSV